jgi:hypothetical protein
MSGCAAIGRPPSNDTRQSLMPMNVPFNLKPGTDYRRRQPLGTREGHPAVRTRGALVYLSTSQPPGRAPLDVRLKLHLRAESIDLRNRYAVCSRCVPWAFGITCLIVPTRCWLCLLYNSASASVKFSYQPRRP